jgi:hypothetical protein
MVRKESEGERCPQSEIAVEELPVLRTADESCQSEFQARLAVSV